MEHGSSLQSPKIASRPNSFVAFFDPKQGAVESVKGAVRLPFKVTVETNEYTATIFYGERDMLTVSPDGQQTLVFAGELYRPRSANTGQTLLGLYEKQGLDFVRDVNGNFSLLLIDRATHQILIATDRGNTFKVLVSWAGDSLIASNSIYLQPLHGARLDRTAVATYLSMSYIYNQRTPFEGLSILDGASVYQLHERKLSPHKYWQFIFQPDTSASVQTLQKEFGDVLVEAVRIRLQPDYKTYLSLSGGYDSGGILGILAALQVPDVRCFSYAHGQPRADSDERVAQQMAALYGYEHQIIPAFDGDIVAAIQRNGHLGGGMTRPADEVDAWMRLGAIVENGPLPVLFNGTTHLHKPDWEIRNVADSVASAHMFDFSLLDWLKKSIGSSAYDEYVASTRAEIDLAVKRVPPTKDGLDLRDMLRFDQIHSRQALTWREYYSGRFFRSASPLLDDDLVDFLLRVPSPLRRARRIYIDTITAMFPRLFALPRARSASYSTYWNDAIKRQKSDLYAFIQGQSSPLDEIIAPEILLALLDTDLAAHTRPNAFLWAAATRAYRLLKKAHWHRSGLVRPSFFRSTVPATAFLVRALTLRSFLAETANLT